MATLTEVTFHIKGTTMLYIPKEELSNIEQACSDKDLLQRLECRRNK
jgi:hypothetical protein